MIGGNSNSGAGAQAQGQAGDQQLIREATSAWNYIFPLLQQEAPQLMATLQGKYTPLIGAARAPVIGQTQQDIRTLQNQAGGAVNPNALYSDIAVSGQQQAGLAGDQMLNSALSALTNLIQGTMSFSGSGLGTASGQLNQLGLSQEELYNQQQDAFWNALLGGAGMALGLGKGGGMTAGAGTPITSGAAAGAAATPATAAAPASMPAAPFPVLGTSGVPGFVSPGYNWSGAPTAMTQSGASAPASSSSSTSNESLFGQMPAGLGGSYYDAINQGP